MPPRSNVRTAAATLASLALLVPVAVLVLAGLSAPGQLLGTGAGLVPVPPTFDALSRAFDLIPFATQLRNSVAIVAVAVPLSLLCASWAAFGMATLQGRARALLVAGALALLAVPAAAVWVPRFVLFSELGLVDTAVPLVAPALIGTTPFAVLLFYWSYRRIPRDLLDAARLSGLGPFAAWRRIAAPHGAPTAAAAGALVFIAHWGSFVEPLLYLYSPGRFTLPLGLAQLRLLGPTEEATVLAGALFVAAPAVIAFVAIRRRFTRAIEDAGWLLR